MSNNFLSKYKPTKPSGKLMHWGISHLKNPKPLKASPIAWPSNPIKYNTWKGMKFDSFPSLHTDKAATYLEGFKKFSIDYAPTSKGKCSACRKRIVKGSPRGYHNDKMQSKHKTKEGKDFTLQIKKLYCYDCALKKIHNERNKHREMVNRLSQMNKMFRRMGRGIKAQRAFRTQELVNTIEKENEHE